MSAPQATNPDAQFPAHDAAAQFSFPKEEEKVLEYWREIDAVSYPHLPSLPVGHADLSSPRSSAPVSSSRLMRTGRAVSRATACRHREEPALTSRPPLTSHLL